MVWFLAAICVAVAVLVFFIAPTGTQLFYLLMATISVAAGAAIALGQDAVALVVVCVLVASATALGSYAAQLARRHGRRFL